MTISRSGLGNGNGAAGADARNGQRSRVNPGTPLAFPVRVFLRFATRTALILIPLTTSAARLHAHTVQTPVSVTQELNRCLLLVRSATSRRGSQNKFVSASRAIAPVTQSTSESPSSLLY